MKKSMLQKSFLLVMLTLVLVLVFPAGLIPAATAAENPAWDDYLGVPGLVCGVTVGDYWGEFIEEEYGVQVMWYSSLAELMDELTHGKVDYAFFGEDVISGLDDSGLYGDVSYLPVPHDVIRCDTAAAIPDPELRAAYNAWLAQSKASGLVDKVMSFYMGETLPGSEDVPEIELTGENGTLVMADSGNYPPWSYPGTDGAFIGIDMELSQRFCQYMGMDFQLETMSYDGILPAIASGRVDMSACLFTVTEDRQEGIEFADPMNTVYGVVAIHQPEGATTPAANSTPEATEQRVYTDFIGKRAAVMVGIAESMLNVAKNELQASEILEYADLASAYEAARQQKVEYTVTDLSQARVLVANPDNQDLEAIEVPADVFSLPMGTYSDNQEHIDAFNAYLSEVEADGTLADIYARWFEAASGTDTPMPEIPTTGENGVLTVATSFISAPFVYLGANSEPKGYEVELMRRFAASTGRTVEFVDMEFSAIIPYVQSGRADFGMCATSITPERQEQVIFSNPTYVDQIALITLKQTQTKETAGFFKWISTAIEKNLITDNRWKLIVRGLGVTAVLAICSQLFGTALGAGLAYLQTRKNPVARRAVGFLQWLVTGLPMMTILLIFYYILFRSAQISNVLTGVAAYTLTQGIAIGQLLVAAIGTIDPIEIEAARAIGFSAGKAFRTVTLPQAVRFMLPGYMTGFVELVKATAIVGYIAIQDLTRASDIIRSRTFDPYFPILFAAVIYLLLTTLFVQLFRLLIKKLGERGRAE